MNASLLQQAGHRPLSVTRSRHDGQSRGSATSSPRRKRRAQAVREPRESRGLRCRGRVHDDRLAPCRAKLGTGFAQRIASQEPHDDRECHRRVRPLLLRARQRRARALGAETFLIDRVAADLAERLGAVLRQFDVAVDLGTPTDAVREALADNASIGTLIAARRFAGRRALGRRRRGGAAVPRRLARSGRVGARAAIRQ